MQTFADIIAAWGDDALFAEDAGAPRSLVAVWKHRNSIPAPYWAGVISGAAHRSIAGVTLELLGQLARQRRSAEAA
jgi:hypothetical protein